MKKVQQGFGLIEVLVTLILTTVGILGMVAMQTRAIHYTQDAVARDTAAALSNELVEILRAHRHELFEKAPPDNYTYQQVTAASDAYNAAGQLQFANNCPTAAAAGAAGGTGAGTQLAQTLGARVSCWVQRVQQTLPGTNEDNFIATNFRVCPSFQLNTNGVPLCAGANYEGSGLAVQVAWRSKDAVCGPRRNSNICTFVTRVEL